jgi:hypothetical protein
MTAVILPPRDAWRLTYSLLRFTKGNEKRARDALRFTGRGNANLFGFLVSAADVLKARDL